ncbi:hypothetical protein PLICRDRAFT_40087 [Plicaturopsis crispa FD-325 SS-3]|nr:hypothetical protein PLICRDRAFT_40087 [Plicaturopsis crispa FD-325 SS-3]
MRCPRAFFMSQLWNVAPAALRGEIYELRSIRSSPRSKTCSSLASCLCAILGECASHTGSQRTSVFEPREGAYPNTYPRLGSLRPQVSLM